MIQRRKLSQENTLDFKSIEKDARLYNCSSATREKASKAAGCLVARKISALHNHFLHDKSYNSLMQRTVSSPLKSQVKSNIFLKPNPHSYNYTHG